METVTFVVEFDPVEHYTARAKGHSIFTQADTLDELCANAREAAACHFDDGAERDIQFRPGIETIEAIQAARRGELAGPFTLDELFEDLNR